MLSEDAAPQLRRYMELRDKRDTSKKQAEIDDAAYREAEADLYEDLENSPIKGSLTLDLGEPWGSVTFSPRATHFGKIIDEEQAIAYYEERGMLEQVSNPKFVKARINEEVRNRLDQGLTPPPGVSYYTNRGITVTRKKK